MRGRTGIIRAAALLSIGLAAACDSGPRGPGVLDGVIEATPSLGAVTLEVTGRGVLGFEGAGSTEAYGSMVSGGREARHRVVLVNPAGGGLAFRVRVEDVGAEPPTLTVLAAVGVDNRERSPGDVEVRVDR